MEKTNEKRNMLKRIMLMLCAAVVAISTVLGSGVTEVQAASKAKKAMDAYAKYLQDGSHWNMDGKMTSFGLIDVNRDGIKELVVYDESTYSTSLIGYVSGKTKQLGWCMRGEIKIYPKKKIFALYDSAGGGIYATLYYKYDGKKAQRLALYNVEYDGDKLIDETYNVHGKNVSKKKYNKYIKSLHLGKGISSSDLKMYKNTAANRNKYLSVSSKKKKVPAGSITIDNKNFPDANFRKYVRTYIDQKVNGKRDGYLSKDERMSVKKIDINYKEIKSLKGIEFFTNLEELDCSGNDIISYLSFPNNPNLVTLNCNNMKLKNLDVSNNPNLTILRCDYSGLSSLNVSHNPKLEILLCSMNSLHSLDVSNNPNLESLWCYINQLSEIDVSHNPKLRQLRCWRNNISSLDLSNNPELEVLFCQYNEITVLDLRNNPKIDYEMFECDDNVKIEK